MTSVATDTITAPCTFSTTHVTPEMGTAGFSVYSEGPFGDIVEESDTDGSGVGSENPFRFSTKYGEEGETGLVYYGYRYYSPELGRWVSRDWIGEQGGFNVYGFLHNEPAHTVDCLGTYDIRFPFTWSQRRIDRVTDVFFTMYRQLNDLIEFLDERNAEVHQLSDECPYRLELLRQIGYAKAMANSVLQGLDSDNQLFIVYTDGNSFHDDHGFPNPRGPIIGINDRTVTTSTLLHELMHEYGATHPTEEWTPDLSNPYCLEQFLWGPQASWHRVLEGLGEEYGDECCE